MVYFDNELLIKILINEEKCLPFEAEEISKNLRRISEELQDALNQWIQNRKIADMSIEGNSFQSIMDKTNCSFLEALFYMSAFIRDPELAARYFKTPRYYL